MHTIFHKKNGTPISIMLGCVLDEQTTTNYGSFQKTSIPLESGGLMLKPEKNDSIDFSYDKKS